MTSVIIVWIIVVMLGLVTWIVFLIRNHKCTTCGTRTVAKFVPQFGEEGSGHYQYCPKCKSFRTGD